jgi:nucleoside-diphosphate-sugar epimerase
MKDASVLIVGCGDLGVRAGTALLQRGWSVAGVRRDATRLPTMFLGHAVDYTQPASLSFVETLRPDFILAIFNPADRSISGYRLGFQTAMDNLLSGLGQHRPRHILMTSSTRVFAEAQGGWVDESSAVTTDDSAALAMLAAERALLESGNNASVVRFAGIYGNPDNFLIARISRGERCPPAPVSYTNRIHREDCAAFLVHLLLKANAGATLRSLYIGVDDDPAPQYEVQCWLAERLGIPDHDKKGQAQRSESASRSVSGNKRCRNLALHQSGYQLKYPDYRSGYTALLASR